MKGITIYCGSSANLPDQFMSVATAVGRLVAKAGVPLITGAGRSGLMGAVVDAVRAEGGENIGVIPQFMVDRGWHNPQMTQLHIVDTMHTRKATMAKLAQGVIALPGGIGTFEELLEIITWRQLGLFDGNIVILNVEDYYAPLLAMFDKAIEVGFMKPDHKKLFTVTTSPQEAVEKALQEPTALHLTPKF